MDVSIRGCGNNIKRYILSEKKLNKNFLQIYIIRKKIEYKLIIGIYNVIKMIIMTICEGISYCWYPTKERCVNCCYACNRRMNPHEDEAFSAFE